jgi:beta-hydroxylase
VKTITTDAQWKTYWLTAVGVDCSENQRRFPETMRILNGIPGMKNAFFSILSPGKYIPPHRGAYNGILRFHLGLIVPEPKEKCRIRVAREVRHWEEGKSLVFDDTFNHEVWNETDGIRAVLFVDFARPLKGALNALNARMISMGALAPAMREANVNLQQWSKDFYGKDN